MTSALQIRSATPDDAEVIHGFIVGLALYEEQPDAVDATATSLKAQMVDDDPPFECIIGEIAGEPVGFALFFRSFSTWQGIPGLYLEDLFVDPAHRGAGHGAALLSHLAAIAIERGYQRVDWQVLDWNKPSIGFYGSIGAHIKREWIPCRLTGDALIAMASRS